jgi:hypothetical protein
MPKSHHNWLCRKKSIQPSLNCYNTDAARDCESDGRITIHPASGSSLSAHCQLQPCCRMWSELDNSAPTVHQQCTSATVHSAIPRAPAMLLFKLAPSTSNLATDFVHSCTCIRRRTKMTVKTSLKFYHGLPLVCRCSRSKTGIRMRSHRNWGSRTSIIKTPRS